MDSQPYHMRPWDEVLGPALGIEEHNDYCLALIGKIPVILPPEMVAKLAEAKGQRVGILRTDSDYRFRVITVMKPEVRSMPLNAAQSAL